MVVISSAEVALAKKYLTILSPLCKGSKGDLIRKYLRFKNEIKFKTVRNQVKF